MTREQLLTSSIGTKEVALADGDVLVRGVTRTEFFAVNAVEDPREREVLLISYGMVDPEMTPDDVRTWMTSASAGDVQDVQMEVGRLSRMVPDAAKELTKRAARRR